MTGDARRETAAEKETGNRNQDTVKQDTGIQVSGDWRQGTDSKQQSRNGRTDDYGGAKCKGT